MTISWTSITGRVYGKHGGAHTAGAGTGGRGWSSTSEPVPQLVARPSAGPGGCAASARLLERAAERGEALALGGFEQPAVECHEVEVGARRLRKDARLKL